MDFFHLFSCHLRRADMALELLAFTSAHASKSYSANNVATIEQHRWVRLRSRLLRDWTYENVVIMESGS